MISFSERIKELRRKNGMTQEGLGKIIGVTPDSIYTYEKGKAYPEARNLLILADYFDVSLDYLMGRTDDPEVHQLAPRGGSQGETVGAADHHAKIDAEDP